MKIIFFDIDGTLWDRQQRIPESTARGIRELKKNGHRVFINTGRTPAFLHYPSLEALPFDGIVSACGCYLKIGGKEIRCQCVTAEQNRFAMELFRKNRAVIFAEGADYQWYNEEEIPDAVIVDNFREGLVKTGHARRLETLRDEDRVMKYLVTTPTDEEAEAAEKGVASFMDAIYHRPRVIEFVQKGMTKAVGLRAVAEYYGAGRDDLYAFGDGMNDMDMIRAVGHGIVMGNGVDELKREAEYVTDDIREDGVWNALKHYGLI